MPCLILDTRYEKERDNGIIRPRAVLIEDNIISSDDRLLRGSVPQVWTENRPRGLDSDTALLLPTTDRLGEPAHQKLEK